MKCGKILSMAVVLAMVNLVYAYTPAETNDIARGMLFRVMSFYNHDNFMNGEIVVRWQGDIPDTWEGFLGTAQEGGRWTTEERKGAFDWYLSTLGAIDCIALPWMDQKLVRVALGRCNVFNSAYLIDELFVSNIEGYATSSNRLETALSMLRQMEPDDFDRKDFIAITNQLLSSGQPLRWVNFGGANE